MTVLSSTICLLHPLFWAQKDHRHTSCSRNNSAVFQKVNVELQSAFPIPELESKHWLPCGQCSRVNTLHSSRSWTFNCGIRPTNRQTFCSKGCRLQTSPEAMKNYMLALHTGIVHVSGVARRVLEPGSWEALALLLANEAPCPSADYQSLLAHRAYFMHCLQETPPGNLYLQGWHTAISSITGWLRETEPIKWILESTGVFTSVPGKGEKKNHCNVECIAHFRKAVHMLCRTQCFSKRWQSKHEQEEAQIV